MHRLLIAASVMLLLSACSFQHIAEIRMKNNHKQPIQIAMETKNISFKSDTIPANTSAVKNWDWTNLEDGEGHITITVYYLNTQQTASYEAGYYNNKTLSNYIDITVQDGDLQFKMSD
jgi:hypothetical protein